jgi:hypothetical protein
MSLLLPVPIPAKQHGGLLSQPGTAVTVVLSHVVLHQSLVQHSNLIVYESNVLPTPQQHSSMATWTVL